MMITATFDMLSHGCLCNSTDRWDCSTLFIYLPLVYPKVIQLYMNFLNEKSNSLNQPCGTARSHTDTAFQLDTCKTDGAVGPPSKSTHRETLLL